MTERFEYRSRYKDSELEDMQSLAFRLRCMLSDGAVALFPFDGVAIHKSLRVLVFSEHPA